jgi:membrane protease YdiL (CAAX protease family)
VRYSAAIVLVVAGFTWVAEPLTGQTYVGWFAAAALGLGLVHAARAGDWGWSSAALLPGLAAAAAFTVAMALVLVGVAHLTGDGSFTADRLRGDARWLLLWGAAQQWLLQTTFMREALGDRKRRRPAVVAALLFGALHLPNPFLTAVTAVSALGWCAIYRRYPNVLPLALSHAIGTVVIRALFDDAITGQLKVGWAYVTSG